MPTDSLNIVRHREEKNAPADRQQIAAHNHNHRKFNSGLADGDGLKLIQRRRALRRELRLPWWTFVQPSSGVY